MEVYGFNRKLRWEAIRDGVIKKRKQGLSYKEIGKLYNASERYIREYLSIEGYRDKQTSYIWTEPRQQELETLILECNSLEEIAKIMGLTEYAIRNRMYSTIGTIVFKKARKFIKGR